MSNRAETYDRRSPMVTSGACKAEGGRRTTDNAESEAGNDTGMSLSFTKHQGKLIIPLPQRRKKIKKMPTPEVLVAGANLLGQTGNMISQSLNNRNARKWQEKMYDRQRADALSDWERQNAYNSPEAQMERFKAAGLNPALIYGQGAGNANAAPVRSSAPGRWSPEAPKFDPGSAIAAYQNTQMMGMQTELMTKQAKVLEEEAKVKQTQQLMNMASIPLKNIDLKGKTFDLSQRIRLADTAAAVMEGTLKQMQANTQYTLDQNTRAGKMNEQQIKESAARIANMAKQNELTSANIKKVAAETEKILFERYNIQPQLARAIGQKVEQELLNASKMPEAKDGGQGFVEGIINGVLKLIF